MMATKLSSALVAPSKVASLLDWRRAVGSVMALDITREAIGLAVAEHPETVCESVPLEPISLARRGRVLPRDLVSELESAVRKHRVCAFVVNWPVNEGRMGESCGRVLSVLDSVVDQSNGVVTRKRPFTLWCNGGIGGGSSVDPSPPDEWGRSASFARAPAYSDGMSYSSKSLLSRPALSSPNGASDDAARVLDEWVKSHWEIDSRMGRATAPKRADRGDGFFFSTHSVDEYTSEKACLQSALL